MFFKIFQSRHNQSAYGPYLATVIWTSGCAIRCQGCFNPHLFDGKLGSKRSPLWLLQTVLKGRKLGDTAVVFVGGEPMDQAVPLLISIALLRLVLPRLTITIFSGYTYRSLTHKLRNRLVLRLATYLIDGPFIAGLASDDLGYRGSANQRVIDLKPSRQSGQVIPLDWDRLIVIDDQSIATTPVLSADLGLTGQAVECGHATKEQ